MLLLWQKRISFILEDIYNLKGIPFHTIIIRADLTWRVFSPGFVSSRFPGLKFQPRLRKKSYKNTASDYMTKIPARAKFQPETQPGSM
jgi:hypothetical protein